MMVDRASIAPLSRGGLRTWAVLAWRRWARRRRAAKTARPGAGEAETPADPLKRPPLIIVADCAFSRYLGVHPAAQLARSAAATGRSVTYVLLSPAKSAPASPADDDGIVLKSMSPKAIEAEITAWPPAAAISIVVKSPHLRSRLAGMAAGRNVALLASDAGRRDSVPGDAPARGDSPRPGVMSSHFLFDEYKTRTHPHLPAPSGRPACLVPLFDPLSEARAQNLRKMIEANASMIFALARLTPGPVPQAENVLSFDVGNSEDFSAAIQHADAVCPDFIADKQSLQVAVVGAAAFHRKPVYSLSPTLQSDWPATVRIDPLDPRIAAPDAPPSFLSTRGAPEKYIAAHDWLPFIEAREASPGHRNVSVIVLTHNNVGIIGRLIETAMASCSSYIKEMIVIDNASVDGSADLVERSFPAVKLIRNAKNGCSSGRNLGVAAATGEYVAFFDSDQWFIGSSGFGEALAILADHPDVGAVGWNAGWFDRTRSDLGGMISDYLPRRGMNEAARRAGFRADIGFLGTSGMFMRRSLFKAIEGFDEFYDPTCFEDTDLCFQIKKAGLKVVFRDLAGVRHQPHQTTNASAASDFYTNLFKRNGDYFREKWKGSPEFFVDHTW